MKKILSLSEVQIRNAKPKSKQYTMFDGGGLYILIKPNGSKMWRLKYRFNGRERLMAVGGYPEVGLKDARAIREEARKKIANNIDPVQERLENERSNSKENSFEFVAREWLLNKGKLLTPGHSKRMERQLETNVFPWLGKQNITKISSADILKILRKIEARGAAETAHRVKSIISRVFRYAGATDRVQQDPCWSLKEALVPVKKQHLAAITKPEEFGLLLRSIDNYAGGEIVRAALKLAPLFFVRPGELRTMKWSDVDLEKAEWHFIASKTKTEHIVPLSKQAITILKDIQSLTGRGKYVLPNPRAIDCSRPLSNNAILAALRNLGYSKENMTGHGFRAAARTMLDEQLHFRPDLIEAQLAHTVRDPLGRAYNRTQYIKERHEMMQAWSDYLDQLRIEAETFKR